MQLTIQREPGYFNCSECNSEQLGRSTTQYSKAFIYAKSGPIKRQMKMEVRVVRIEREFDKVQNTHKAKAVLEIPCLSCGKTETSFESIVSVQIDSIFQAFKCPDCGNPLSVLKSNYTRKEISEEIDELRVSARLKCMNPKCRMQEFARKTIEYHYDQILQSRQENKPLEIASNTGNGVNASDTFLLKDAVEHLMKSNNAAEFNSNFDLILANLHDLNTALIEDELKSVGTGTAWSLPSNKRSKLNSFINELLVQGAGGAVGQLVGTFILRSIGMA